jgi:hypothetical protein
MSNTTKDATAATAAAAKEVVQERSKKKIYLGPSTRKLAHGMIIDGELPGFIKDEIKDFPAMGELIVPMDDIVQAEADIGRKGTQLNSLYELVKAKKGV